MEETYHQEVARCLFRESNDALFIFDPRDDRVVDVNPAAQRLTGLDKKELRRLKVTELFSSVAPGGLSRLIDAYLATGFFHSREGYSLIRASGEPIPVNISVSRMHTEPNPLGLAVVRDVAERKRAEAALRESEERYRLLFDSNPQPMWVVDLGTQTFLEVNEAAFRHYGYTRDEFAAKGAAALVADPESPESADPVRPGTALGQFIVRQRHRKKDGTLIEVEQTEHQVLFRGRPSKLVLVQDVTERRRAEQALIRQAMHDTLTGLPNRAMFHQSLGHAVAPRETETTPFALMLIDLDRFKEINDTLGHHCGDAVLREVGARLRSTLRETDTIARLGGDEFAVLLPGGDEQVATSLAGRVIEVMRPPFMLQGQGHEVGASVGIALYPHHGTDSSVVMRRADAAMYLAKRSRRGFTVFRPEDDQAPSHWTALASDLRTGIDEGQFFLHYQPAFDLRSESITAVEALVRWRHPREGLLPPAQFLALAEEAGLTEPLGIWVLRTALAQCRSWRQAGLDPRVAVNVSAALVHDRHFPAIVAELLNETGVPASHLTLEITEAALVADPASAKDALARLRAIGIKISVDDFGTGLSSLALLKDLPLDELKLDRSLIEGIVSDRRIASVVGSVVNLGHSLGLRVVAEGVEDKLTLDALTSLGCDVAQGYHLGRPMLAEEFARLNGVTALPVPSTFEIDNIFDDVVLK